MQFGIIVRDGGNRAELLVHGELDVATAPMMGTTLSAAVTSHPFVVVDLAHVPFIDSTGIGTLIDGAKRARAAGGDVCLRALRPNVRRAFALMGVDCLFELLLGVA